ncbi:hypothetical protein CWI38_0520p0030 [Hamiltosporidium tvaerminnensis]|uniref:Uncharacterized protein n=1 Tax=Hamiltosporidium tvaerminnensis TaxID=1176355 RepID=A0A4Q9LWS9_9MICR|nr:hypothetical protein CWI38_0520p0030 [Hamiltosporidium tvaerminnensis]
MCSVEIIPYVIRSTVVLLVIERSEMQKHLTFPLKQVKNKEDGVKYLKPSYNPPYIYDEETVNKFNEESYLRKEIKVVREVKKIYKRMTVF